MESQGGKLTAPQMHCQITDKPTQTNKFPTKRAIKTKSSPRKNPRKK
uniref:Uncharacterized protein n=1 Tax=Arundo donax TaxID=35708 RepID=A0A0A9D1J3_ARUDO